MFQKHLPLFVLLILLIVLANCTPTTIEQESTPFPPSQRLPTATPLPTGTKTPAVFSTPMGNEIINILTPDLVAPLNPTAILPITPMAFTGERPVSCHNSQPFETIGSDDGIAGILGLALRESNENLQAILLGGTPLREKTLFPSTYDIRELGFSPDEKWFAYQQLNLTTEPPLEPFVYLLSSQGEQLITPIPLQENETDGWWYSNWITNEWMLLSYNLPPDSDSILDHKIIIFNPFTGKKVEGILEGLIGWNRGTTPYFSPDMTRVVFIQPKRETDTIILWDLEQGQAIWEKDFASAVRLFEIGLGGMSGFSNSVMWSSDSSTFVFGGWLQDEFVTHAISRIGEEKIIIQSPERWGVIHTGVWSPDSRYLVYIDGYFDNQKQTMVERLMLYDFVLDEKIELCSTLTGFRDALWSPDSTHLAFAAQLADGLQLLTLNIYSGEIVSLGNIGNFLAAKWLQGEEWLSFDG